MNIRNVTLICPYDNSIPLQVTSYRAFMPRYGLLVVDSALRNAGYDVKTYCELSGSSVDWKRVRESEVVCFSLMSFSSHKGYEYAEKVRRLNPAAVIIFGGSHPSVLPEDCLKYCDYVVRNEGEVSVVELLAVLSRGEDTGGISGISYMDESGLPRHNPSREFLDKLECVADPGMVDGYSSRSLPFYIKDTFINGIPRFNIAVAQASRGCPGGCRFCFVKHELGKKYRMKDPELVVREIELSIERLGTRYVFFADNDLTLDREHALEVFRLLRERFHGDLDLFFFSRIFISRDEELMRAIEDAGRACIGVGVESLESGTLELLSKKQSINDIEMSLEQFGKYRVKLQLLFIFGSDTDDIGTLERSLAIALKHKVYNWGFCSLYDFPTRESVLGIPQLIADDRFIHNDWRFFSGNFVVHFPERMRPSQLQKGMSSVYRRFYAENKAGFYQYHPIQATYKYYIPFLEKAEAGLYSKDNILRKELLPYELYKSPRISISFNRLALAEELARFYFYNMTRAQSWKYLFSIGKRPGSQ